MDAHANQEHVLVQCLVESMQEWNRFVHSQCLEQYQVIDIWRVGGMMSADECLTCFTDVWKNVENPSFYFPSHSLNTKENTGL